METTQETSQEPEFKPVPLLELRAGFAQREQARIARILRRDRLNNWVAGFVILLLGGITTTLLLVGNHSLSGSAATQDVRRGR